jgi:serine/threonine protein kinase
LDTQVGTDRYMAPEQAAPGSVVIGSPSDVWGIGVTLFEAASGYHPFPQVREEERWPQIENDPLPIAEDLPYPFKEVVLSAIEKSPANRPSAAELAEGLEPVLAALPTRPRLGRLKPTLR